MRRKINPFVLLILIVALGAALYQGGVLDLFSKYDSASDVNEKENASEVGTSDVPETKEIDANHVHKASMTKKLNKVAATCQKKGGYEKVKYCSCGVEMSRKHVTTKKKEHKYTSKKTKATCTKAGKIKYTCSMCGKSYTKKSGKAKGHNYKSGKCTVCNAKDPNYVRTWTGKEIMSVLDKSVVSSTGGYGSYTGADTVSVFAEEYKNCFAFNTAVSYNLWGHNEQYVVFNVKELNKMKTLWMNIGGETGGKGKVKVDIYLDKTMDSEPDNSYEIDMTDTPKRIKVNLKDATSMGIHVKNCASNTNRIVFFDLSSKE